jgi:tyrosine decarboxylase/aspartate 1-decarboxylase
MCGGATEANIQGLWVLRNMFLQAGKKEVHVYMTKLTHYSILKACDILAIPRSCQHIVPLNAKYEFDYDAFKTTLEKMDRESGHIVVLTLGSTLTGGVDNVRKVSRMCETLAKDVTAIHIDAAFGGHVIPFLTKKQYGFENSQVMTIALDADKNGGLPYPSGVFLCRKDLQRFVEVHVEYILGHCDDTLSGSRPGFPALLGLWWVHRSNQKEYVHHVMALRDELWKKLKTIPSVGILPVSRYTNMLAITLTDIDRATRTHLEKKYMLRSTEVDGKLVYKICVFPHFKGGVIDQFVADLARE